MATALVSNGLTLAEVAKRKDPNGNMATIAEVLEEENLILQDAIWREANDTFSNTSTRRSQEPTGSFRKLNSGVSVEKSATVQVVDTIGMLDAISKNDVEIINAFPNPAQGRSDEAMPFAAGLGKTMAATMIYGNTITTPEKFTGLAPRLDDIVGTDNVINEGGTGSDLTSLFVIDWDPNKVFMAYPKNSKVGLEHIDMGVKLVTDVGSNEFRAYVDYFTWKAGMVVKNFKSIGRLANIESTGTSNIFDEDNLITLLNRMTKGPGRRIYVNEVVMTQMEIRLKDKMNIHFTKDDGLAPGGVMFFKQVPIRQVDQILITEAALT
jgi:hypothetical protein